ncbi:S-arrestin b isoform X1 [Pangasianodon hypophthalmus]|uniref:S-arrestin b isoform X1 n=1 Tax=Pangasianodon hypophthalmus TaxID=310915 RepID=UPI0014804450|nr:S-arrestin b isoform X1 [Pangasianodon hypophthalmus]
MSPKHVIYKKQSRDKSVGIYMGRRDFVDHCDSADPVDGVVLLDPQQIKGKKVYVMLSCTFRYGRDDTDILGWAFRRDIYVCTRQVYPPLQDRERSIHTKLQERLLRKLGDDAHPFFFEFPDNLPCSVALQPAPTDEGKHCAVEFEVKAFCAENQDEKAHKRSSVRLAIRKVQYAPDKGGAPPSNETTCEFMVSDKPLHVRVALEKETYYHGEPINVSVDIDNSSSKDVKNLTVSVEQMTNVVLYSNDKYIKSVACEEATDIVPSGTSLKKVYTLHPLLKNNHERRGLALDGKLKHEDTNLASSSIVKAEVLKEILGMLVSYRVVVRGTAAGMIGSSEVAVEVPFLLMHPKPEEVRTWTWCLKSLSARISKAWSATMMNLLTTRETPIISFSGFSIYYTVFITAL